MTFFLLFCSKTYYNSQQMYMNLIIILSLVLKNKRGLLHHQFADIGSFTFHRDAQCVDTSDIRGG